MPRFLSTGLAPKEEKPKVPKLTFYLAYDLTAYNGEGLYGIARVGTRLSGLEYALWPLECNARNLQASALQTAGALCITAQML